MRRSLSAFLHTVGIGLMFLGALHYAPMGMMVLQEDEDQPQGPPPGHPERLVPQLELSPVERELWGQIRSVG